MKAMSRLLAIFLAAAMLLSMGVFALAEEAEIKIYAICVDENGKQFEGTEKREIQLREGNNTISQFDAPMIEGYVADSLVDVYAVIKTTDSMDESIVTYTVVTGKADEKYDLTESTTFSIRYVPVTDETPAVEYVDETGKEIREKGDLSFIAPGATIGLEDLPTVEGYTAKAIRYGEAEVSMIRRTNYTNYRQEDMTYVYHYQANGEDGVLDKNGTVRFVYAQDAAHEHTWDVGKVTKEATCTESGEKTYTCTVCGESKTEEIAKLEHQYDGGACKVCGEKQEGYKPKLTKGDNTTAYHETDFVVRSDAAFKDFQKVLIDGNELSKSYYTVKEGSTIVTIKGSYITKLSTGSHKIAIVSATGTAEGTFKVSDRPKTGDGDMTLWMVLLGISAMGTAASVLYSKKRRTE